MKDVSLGLPPSSFRNESVMLCPVRFPHLASALDVRFLDCVLRLPQDSGPVLEVNTPFREDVGAHIWSTVHMSPRSIVPAYHARSRQMHAGHDTGRVRSVRRGLQEEVSCTVSSESLVQFLL